jgi:hypothetical protein
MTATSLTLFLAAATSAKRTMPAGASVRERSALRGNDHTTLALRCVR